MKWSGLWMPGEESSVSGCNLLFSKNHLLNVPKPPLWAVEIIITCQSQIALVQLVRNGGKGSSQLSVRISKTTVFRTLVSGGKKSKKTYKGIKGSTTVPPTAPKAGKCIKFSDGRPNHTLAISLKNHFTDMEFFSHVNCIRTLKNTE